MRQYFITFNNMDNLNHVRLAAGHFDTWQSVDHCSVEKPVCIRALECTWDSIPCKLSEWRSPVPLSASLNC